IIPGGTFARPLTIRLTEEALVSSISASFAWVRPAFAIRPFIFSLPFMLFFIFSGFFVGTRNTGALFRIRSGSGARFVVFLLLPEIRLPGDQMPYRLSTLSERHTNPSLSPLAWDPLCTLVIWHLHARPVASPVSWPISVRYR